MIYALIFIENHYFLNMVKELSTFYGEEKTSYVANCFQELAQNFNSRYSTNARGKFESHLKRFAEKVLSIN